MPEPAPVEARSAPPTVPEPGRAEDVHRRVRIGLTGLGGVVAAILVAGALVNRTAQDVMADMANNTATLGNDAATTRNDPLSEIGAAPAAEPLAPPVEAVPGTGATVDPVTGNVSDLPARRGRR